MSQVPSSPDYPPPGQPSVPPPPGGLPQPPPGGSPPPQSNKLVVGIVAILLGGLGIHKFLLGMPVPGVILLCATVLTCGFGGFITGIIGIIEGIIYLTKTDEQFHQEYVVGKKQWF